MKKIIQLMFILGIATSFIGCKKQNIMLYSDSDYIQFTTYTMDSTTCSFLAFPNENTMLYPVEVEVVGFPSGKDREFKIVVVDEYTNAPTANYTLPDKFVVRAGNILDTCWITIKKTLELSAKAVRLSIRLEESKDFHLGQIDKLGQIIYITNILSKPDWWTAEVTKNFLGNYSDTKFRLFIEVTGIADFDSSNLVEMRLYTVMLKNYLRKEKDAGHPVLEVDGTEMTVPFFGN